MRHPQGRRVSREKLEEMRVALIEACDAANANGTVMVSEFRHNTLEEILAWLANR